MRLETRVDAPSDLAAEDRNQLFDLMVRHYAGVGRAPFERDLAEKTWVIRLLDPATGDVCGFSTQMVLEAQLAGRPVRALFSGDTIVDRRCWGSTALPIAWGRLAVSLVEREPQVDWYWMLICKGFRTYRFLPVFFREFFPRHDAPWPRALRDIRDQLAKQKFGAAFDATAGIVQAERETYTVPLNDDGNAVRRDDRHIAFFLDQNPGHVRGDELCCLAPLSRENFTAAGRRLMATPEFQLGRHESW